MQAVGVYQAAWRAGVRIPRDLGAVGFDDLPFRVELAIRLVVQESTVPPRSGLAS